MEFWSLEALLCVLLLDAVFIFSSLSQIDNMETEIEEKVIVPLEASLLWSKLHEPVAVIYLSAISLTQMAKLSWE